ncbi:acyl-CoA thioesterase [Marinomonas algarum]|uniref:Acyl-CoA thioesterase n=1 Tax=Marinomonas algarum TaxID=2883105 RepID=A0A9X1ILP1_9GAMM|nr:acyl-CoA thioesterase [Marinomonas algarum]MCB5161044.1 acyl-CoA thioesterase [Marinomonas algarum]
MNKLLIQKREELSETRVAKMVFPGTTNHYDTLFGGIALQWMDEVAYIAATRFSRKTVVTISTEQIDFKQPIPAGILVELVARVIHVGRTSLKVEVSIYLEQLHSDGQEKAITGHFNFVAVDEESRKPVPIFDEDTATN